jgi:stage II sporulation protein R
MMKKFFSKELALSAILAVSLGFAALTAYAKSAESRLADNFLRLHVVANSDSPEDQNLKLLVRDKFLSVTKDILKSCATKAEASAALSENSEKITNELRHEIIKNGFAYDVNLSVGKFNFPTKTYGSVALPAGRYDAARITIGSGSGKNWWCVIYPPLCVVNGVNCEIQKNSARELCSNLTDTDFRLITDTDKPEVELKFKIIESLAPLFSEKTTALTTQKRAHKLNQKPLASSCSTAIPCIRAKS